MNPQSPNSSFNDRTLLPDIFNDNPSSDPSADLSFLDPFPPSIPSNPSNSDAMPSNFNPEGDGNNFSESMLEYINQVLMEEDLDSKPSMFHDHLALQTTEQSLCEVIGGNQHPLNHVHQNVDIREHRSSILQSPTPENFVFQSTTESRPQLNGNGNERVGSYSSDHMVPNVLTENDILFQFNRGIEEGSKFLPRGQLISIESNKPDAMAMAMGTAKNGGAQMGKDQREQIPTGLRRKKNHQREDIDLEDGRCNKQSSICLEDEEGELSEILDNVFISREKEKTPVECDDDRVDQNEENKGPHQEGQSVEIGSGKKGGKNQGNTKEVVDLRALLISCAEAVSVDDQGTAIELLKQIRRHSSQFGDGTQRLAHCFANALEARFAGIGSQMYIALSSKRVSAADLLKIYLAYQSVVPYMKIAMIFANHMILKYAEKAETLHVVDFGILDGFQWPALIHCLSRRAGGPPKLRITGIDLPLSGFRPEEKVQETGVRLAKYCRRFNVPFEYNGIAKKWETIQLEDLKVQRNEVLAVNSVCRLKNLLDETVVVNSPRDAVLTLIKMMNPDIFVQCVVNASYSEPFFVSRFRETLFRFSSYFDMFDTTLPREDEMRLGFEREFIGPEVMNIIACEGYERTVRPETYKQWQIRNKRFGFRQLPLDREVMNKIRDKVKHGYNPNFLIDEDGCWMLQGWKGRITLASTCWAPCRS